MSIHVLGTNHISEKSVQAIKEAVKALDPDIVAIELDAIRLDGLVNKQKTRRLSWRIMRQLGLKAYIFSIIASHVQQAMGKVVNMQPGSEMLMGAKLAKKHKKQLALIDQPITITMRRLNRVLSIKDVGTMIVDAIYGVFRPRQFTKKYNINTQKVKELDPDAIQQAMRYMEIRFPGMYRVLVHERNVYMVQQLINLQEPGKTILAVVGAGHVAGMLALLEEPMHTYAIQDNRFTVSFEE